MTSRAMKVADLRRWNLIQAALIERLGITEEPTSVIAFGEWFANQVDVLRRLPRWTEIREHRQGAVLTHSGSGRRIAEMNTATGKLLP